MKTPSLIVLLILGISVNAAKREQLHTFWKGTMTSGSIERVIELEFGNEGSTSLLTWSIPETGSLRNQAKGAYDAQKKIWRSMDGSIRIKITKSGLEGYFEIHGFSGQIRANRTEAPERWYNEENIRFGIGLDGALLTPTGSGPFPLIIFIHGSGPGVKDEWRYAAERFVKLGFACFIYDKRGSGNSDGSWIKSSLDDLATDVSDAIEFLRTYKEIDQKKIGIYSHSQGGWVLNKLLSITSQVNFSIAVNGGGITPKDSETKSYLTALRHNNISIVGINEAQNLLEKYFSWLGSGEGKQELEEALESSKSTSWKQYIHIPIPSEENRVNWEWVANYNPVPDIAGINGPALVVTGGEDFTQNDGLAIMNWSKGIIRNPEARMDVMLFSAGNHGMRIGNHDHGPIFWQPYVDGFWSAVENWLRLQVLKE